MASIEQFINALGQLEYFQYSNRSSIKRALERAGISQDEYCISNGASKYCVIPNHSQYILKWDKESADAKDADMGAEEVRIYKLACAEGIEMFFPETEIVGHFKFSEVAIVKQQKIDYSAYDVPMNKRKRYQQKIKTVRTDVVDKIQKEFNKARGGRYTREVDNLWACMCCLMYGRNNCIKLCRFVVDNNINDLHEGNVGYYKNKPIILDFCGYE